MGNADALIRLPLPEHPEVLDIPTPGDIKMLFQHLSDTIITAFHICKWTEKTLHYQEFTTSSFMVGKKQFLIPAFDLISIIVKN